MSRNENNGKDLNRSHGQKPATQFAHGGHPLHGVGQQQVVKTEVPPSAMDDYTMMMIQAMEGRS